MRMKTVEKVGAPMLDEDISLRNAAEELGIEPLRIKRLAHYLKLDLAEERLPRDVVEQIDRNETPDARYAALLHWLLERMRAAG